MSKTTHRKEGLNDTIDHTHPVCPAVTINCNESDPVASIQVGEQQYDCLIDASATMSMLSTTPERAGLIEEGTENVMGVGGAIVQN